MFALNQTTASDLSLAGSLTIYEVAQARDALLAAFAESRDASWRLDLHELGELDSAGAQLLLAAHRHLREAGGDLQLSALSEAARELLGLLNLGTLLTGEPHAQ
ncbi:STAS domain-containing protein [Pseudomonas sp. CAU 1711]|uniref:STAS domain-containing protein n=1 Tax=Pseudomonas sp. CAU 1711 TaxID=3140356 RepID=UPI0032600350